MIKFLLLLFLVPSLVAFEFERNVNAQAKDGLGLTQKYSLFGEAQVGARNKQLQVNFGRSIDPYEVTTIVTGSGSMQATSNLAVLSAGASTNSSATIISRDVLIYHTGIQSEYAFTASWPGQCLPGAERIMRVGDDEGDLDIGCVDDEFVIRHSDGAGDITTVVQSDWNNPASTGPNALTTNSINIYRWSFAWFGVAQISLEFLARDGRWTRLHTFVYQGVREYPHLKNPSMPIQAFVKNTTNTTSQEMRTVCWAAWNVETESSITHRDYSFVAGINHSTESHLASGRVTETFQGVHNHIPIKLRKISTATDGTKIVTVRLYKNCDLTGGAWLKYGQFSSVIESNVGVTSFSNCERLIDAVTLTAGSSPIMEFPNGGAILRPGETMTITAESSQGTANTSAVATWDELF